MFLSEASILLEKRCNRYYQLPWYPHRRNSSTFLLDGSFVRGIHHRHASRQGFIIIIFRFQNLIIFCPKTFKFNQLFDGFAVQEQHEVYIDFEPLTGTPISAWKRLQYNIFIFPVLKFKPMRNFPDALLPLVWVEEGIELSDAPDLLNHLMSILNLVTVLK